MPVFHVPLFHSPVCAPAQNSDNFVCNTQKLKLMAYSHCTGPALGQVQGTGPGAMVTNMLYRNVHTGQR